MKIQNADTLISHGSIKARRLGLDVAEKALASVETYEATKKLITLKDGQILLPNRRISLTDVNHIFVIGAGKASTPIARATKTSFSHIDLFYWSRSTTPSG